MERNHPRVDRLCVICGVENIMSSAASNFSSWIATRPAESSIQVITILHKLLQISLSECGKYLNTLSSSSSSSPWLQLCSSCTTIVEQGQFLVQEIEVLQSQLQSVQSSLQSLVMGDIDESEVVLSPTRTLIRMDLSVIGCTPGVSMSTSTINNNGDNNCTSSSTNNKKTPPPSTTSAGRRKGVLETRRFEEDELREEDDGALSNHYGAPESEPEGNGDNAIYDDDDSAVAYLGDVEIKIEDQDEYYEGCDDDGDHYKGRYDPLGLSMKREEKQDEYGEGDEGHDDTLSVSTTQNNNSSGKATKRRRDRHSSNEGSKRSKIPCPCSFCPQVLESWVQMYAHVRTSHPAYFVDDPEGVKSRGGGTITPICITCGNSYSTLASLRTHRELCGGKK